MAQDPWDWSNDDLIAQVCHSRTLFDAAGYGPANCPEPKVFEARLREQQITGASFLTAITDEVLRGELGIQPLGQRHALLSLVSLLRSRSLRYNQHAASHPQPRRAEVEAMAVGNDRKRRKMAPISVLPLPGIGGVFGSNDDHDLAHYSAPNVQHDSHEWDYLLDRWMTGEDEIIDFAATTDQDEEEDGEEEMGIEEAEDEEVVPEKTAMKGKISDEKVIEVINTAISSFTDAYLPGGGGYSKQSDPRQMWKKAQDSGQRQQLAEASRINVRHYEGKLDQLGDEIRDIPWNSKDEIRRQCCSLEGTVHLLEHEKWLLSVYERGVESPQDNVHDDVDEPSLGNRNCAASMSSDRRCATQQLEIIDLGSESDVSSSGGLHASSPARAKDAGMPTSAVHRSVEMDVNGQNQTEQKAHFGENPETASIHAVSGWRWDDLVASADRKRIIMKAIHAMKADDREMIRFRVNTVKRQHLLGEIPKCVGMLLTGKSRMQGVLARDSYKLVIFTKLFLCWWSASDCFNRETTHNNLAELAECLENGTPDPDKFYDWLRYILKHTFSEEALAQPHRPSQAEVIVISDDED